MAEDHIMQKNDVTMTTAMSLHPYAILPILIIVGLIKKELSVTLYLALEFETAVRV